MNKRFLIEEAFKAYGGVLRFLPSGYAPLPPLIIWELTFRCNLHCEMCAFYGRHGILPDTSNELTTEQVKGVIGNLAYSYRNYPYKPLLGFTGGEPFMRNDLLEIVAYARKKGFGVSITTNFAIPAKETLKELIRLKPSDIRVSVDGPEDVHNRIRGVDVFDKVVDNIKFVKSNSGIPVRINCTITEQNLDHLDYMLGLAHNLKVHLNLQYPIFLDESHIKAHSIATANKLGECLNYRADMDTLSKEQVKQLMAAITNIIKKARKLKQPLTFTPNITPDKLSHYYHDLSWLPSRKCTFVWNGARISPDGRVYPCFEYYYGDLKKEPFSKVWNSSAARRFRKTIKKGLLPACVRCCKL